MKQRGRRPAAAKAVVIQGAFGNRPEPPDDLTERQAEIWRAVVSSEDSKFFDTGALRGLLADYCRRREASENISVVINAFKPEWLKNSEGAKRYKDLLIMRDVEVRGATALARSLRLTNQSRYYTNVAGTAARNAAKAAKPWEA